MKKKLVLSLILATTVVVSATAGAFAATKIKLVVNGKLASAETKVIDGTTYVPLRAAAELLGASVKFDASTSTVTITSSGSTTPTTPTQQSSLKSYNTNVTLNSGPMTLKISKVTLDPAYKEISFSSTTQPAMILDVTVENTTNDKLTWYVDQSVLVLNTKEQLEKTLLSDTRISSDFNGKVVKKGKIVYPVTSNFNEISSFRFLSKAVRDDKFTTVSEASETEVILK